MAVLSGLQPQKVFHYFEELCKIPHGSYNTKQISDYCVAFARERGLRCLQDEANNVIIFKDGTPGYENSAPVILQGHLDMVCEKAKDCDIDFEKDGLRLRYENGLISADGTTLGGDDGIAIAYSLAILDSDDIPHPPLQIIFTTDEEVGMLGAVVLDCSPITSRIMINLDSEEEGIFWVSCAGGATAFLQLPIKREDACASMTAPIKIRLGISGLAGGHSGAEIDKGGANASMLLGRTLYLLKKKMNYALISAEGGLKDNAIPKEAYASLYIEEADLPVLQKFVEQYQLVFAREYSVRDPKLTLSAEKADCCCGDCSCETALDADSQAKLLTALMNLPNGIQSMSMNIPGLVQTSLTLGVLKTEKEAIHFTFSVRSSLASEKEAVLDRLESLITHLGGNIRIEGDYPAWEYCENSPLRDTMLQAHKDLFGYEPKIEAIHAGLECGIFSGLLPGLDCVSIGPAMKDIHTFDEVLDAASVAREWDLLLEVLKRLK